jgi:hypothetical protein
VAPPQYQGMWLKALTLIDGKPELLAKNGSVIVQIHPREETPVTLDASGGVRSSALRFGAAALLRRRRGPGRDDDDAGDEDEDGGWRRLR